MSGTVESPAHRRCHETVTDHQFNAYLTIGLLTDSPAILMSDSYRILALFEPAGFVDNPGLNGFEVRTTSRRITRHSSVSSQGLSAMNCWSRCGSIPSLAAIGSIDLRCPGISRPCT